MLFFLFALYPVLHLLDSNRLLPQPLRAPVRTLLSLLDADPDQGGPAGLAPLSGNPAKTGKLQELPEDIAGYLIVDCLDVGQAGCALIRQGSHAMLYDCGAEAPVQIRRFLADEGIRELDMVVLSHGDADHINAFPAVAYEEKIGRVLVSPYMFSHDTKSYDELWESIRWYDLRTAAPSPGDTFPLGDAMITVLGPVSYDEEIENNNCLMIRVTYGDTAVLFCGDAQSGEERSAVEAGRDLHSQVLFAGHHGSNNSSTGRFLEAVSPEWAVISCGKDNDYGHPGEYALQRLADCGAAVVRTDRDGAIRFISDGESFQVSTCKK